MPTTNDPSKDTENAAGYQNAERLRAILDTAADAIVTIDSRGIIVDVNRATNRMFGYAEGELVGQNVSILMPSPFREEHDGYIERFLRTGEAKIIGVGRRLVACHRDGRTIPVDLAVSQVDDLGLFTGILRDVSERLELEARIVETAAEEQRRIGQELHDGIGQQLTGLSLIASTLQELFPTCSPAALGAEALTPENASMRTWHRCSELINRLQRGIDDCQRQVRILARGILPVQVDAEGLRAGLRELVDSVAELAPLTCLFDSPSPVQVHDNTVANHLYRIAQESIHNAVRHSRATRIILRFHQSAGQIRLEVDDNGQGIPADSLNPSGAKGAGLRIMRHRANLVGGLLEIVSHPREGTRITCTLPDDRPVPMDLIDAS